MLETRKLTKEWIAGKLLVRPKDANKGTFGRVLVIAGSENFPGAAYLSCSAAYRVGAGLVTLVTDRDTKIIISKQLPELTFFPYNQVFEKVNDYDVILLGPGLGQQQKTAELVRKVLREELPKTVIDADGLNILSKTDDWWNKINGEIILTPHTGEMSRLTGLSVEEIQKNRIDIAQKFAKKWGQTVVLKGANTVIASFDGRIFVSPFANPILATAGTGDVLAGIVAGLLAQGLDAINAANVGVYIHGLAGEGLKEKIGNAGALASDLLPLLPQILKKLR